VRHQTALIRAVTPAETLREQPPDRLSRAAADLRARRPMTSPPAPYCVVAEPRIDYLRIVITGQRSTLQASIDGWREVGRLVGEHRTKRVLVVSELTGPLPTPEEQRVILEALIGWGFEGVRTAFVLADIMNVSKLEHGEIVARELGQESRVFGSEAVAEVWLRYGESGKA